MKLFCLDTTAYVLEVCLSVAGLELGGDTCII